MNKSETIEVIIVDDHPIVRHGIKTILLTFEDILVVGEAGNGAEALSLCAEAQPDVVLMDIVMPGMNGVEATHTLLERYPLLKIIILTSFPNQEAVQETLEAGAVGFLLKDTPKEIIGDAIRSAYAGRTVLAPEATEALIRAKTGPPKLGYDLSDRELEVLALVVEGLSNAEIAEQLVISPNTARNHVSACISKLGATNRAQAAALATKYKLIS
jgi:NarL family two-component system response regulator LiaR